MTNSQERHSAIYMLGRIVPAAINLGSTAVFTRLAAPDTYAVFVVAYASAQIGSALFFQWLRQGLLRFAPSASKSEVVGTIGALYAIQAVITLALTVLLASFTNIQTPELTLLCGALTLGQAWFDFVQELQRAEMKSKKYALLFFLRSATGLILGALALTLTGSGVWLTLAVLISFLVPPTPFVATAFKGASFDKRLMQKVVTYSWPLIISTSLATAGMVGDRILVAAMMDAAHAGQYGPSVDIARQGIFVFVQGVALAGYPLAIRALEAGDREGAILQLRKNAELLVLIAMPATLGVIAVSESIASVLLGPEYQSSARLLLPISAVASLAMCLRTFYFDQAMQLGKKTGGQVAVSVVILATFISTSAILIPRVGIMGAATALLASQLIGLLASWLIGRVYFKLPFPLTTFIKVLLASAGMYASITIFKKFLPQDGMLSLVLLIVSGAIVYSAAVLAMNTLGCRDYIQRRLVQGRRS